MCAKLPPCPILSAQPADAAARNYLSAQLTQLGLQPQIFSSLGVDPTARA